MFHINFLNKNKKTQNASISYVMRISHLEIMSLFYFRHVFIRFFLVYIKISCVQIILFFNPYQFSDPKR